MIVAIQLQNQMLHVFSSKVIFGGHIEICIGLNIHRFCLIISDRLAEKEKPDRQLHTWDWTAIVLYGRKGIHSLTIAVNSFPYCFPSSHLYLA